MYVCLSLLFYCSRITHSNFNYVQVPFGLCRSISMIDDELIINTKDLRKMTFAYAGDTEKWQKLLGTLKWIAFPKARQKKSEKDLMAMLGTEKGREKVTEALRHTSLLPPRKLYVYERHELLSRDKNKEIEEHDWRSALLLNEYNRQGVVASSDLRISTANQEYKLCETYPRVLVTLKSLSDKNLSDVAEFRSKSRVPICTSCFHIGRENHTNIEPPPNRYILLSCNEMLPVSICATARWCFQF